MPHPLVLQLRFTRSEFQRGLAGLGEADAARRLPPMNCISWNVGHLAWQEQRYWFFRLRGLDVPAPRLNELVAYGQPATTPALAEMQDAWQMVTRLADPFLDSLATADLRVTHVLRDQQIEFTAGNLLQRVIYHYWYHTGENLAIRQMLGHTDLPEFVGNIDDEAPYQPDGER
ncbi:MAG TPA: DinB family protein [Ktedonobacterales bacterium]|nr:DinB family protein [Ktedonobacterales bacterium]